MPTENNKRSKYTAVVTGSSGYIGKALCKKLSKNGFDVLGLDIQKPDHSFQNDFIMTDLEAFANDEDYAHEITNKIKENLNNKPLKLLVNNAAIQIIERIDNLSRLSWRRTMSVNTDAPLFLSKALLPLFSKNNGSIINISSIHARLTKRGFISYSASKAALSAVTKSLAIEVGDRVRVNAIEPAAIKTPMLQAGLSEKSYEQLCSFHPQKKLGTPEDIANLVLAITLGEFSFMHGSCIDISGAISSRLHDPE